MRVQRFRSQTSGNCVTFLDNAGNVQAHYVYDAFGGTVSDSGDMADVFRFRFSSKYLDGETGLYYYGFRFYDPVTGRWLSRDPISEAGGLMLYAFVNNNALSSWDSLGLLSKKHANRLVKSFIGDASISGFSRPIGPVGSKKSSADRICE